jgi:hypothetical protein
LVLAGIEEGLARVFVNGTERGSLLTGDQVLARFYSTPDQPALLNAHTGAVGQRMTSLNPFDAVALSCDG